MRDENEVSNLERQLPIKYNIVAKAFSNYGSELLLVVHGDGGISFYVKSISKGSIGHYGGMRCKSLRTTVVVR